MIAPMIHGSLPITKQEERGYVGEAKAGCRSK